MPQQTETDYVTVYVSACSGPQARTSAEALAKQSGKGRSGFFDAPRRHVRGVREVQENLAPAAGALLTQKSMEGAVTAVMNDART